MRILLNITMSRLNPDGSTPELPSFALSVGEDEDGIIVVGLIGSIPTSSPSGDGEVWHVGGGYYELLDPHDAEEVADACRMIAPMEWSRGDAMSKALAYELRRIADVLYAMWQEEGEDTTF